MNLCGNVQLSIIIAILGSLAFVSNQFISVLSDCFGSSLELVEMLGEITGRAKLNREKASTLRCLRLK